MVRFDRLRGICNARDKEFVTALGVRGVTSGARQSPTAARQSARRLRQDEGGQHGSVPIAAPIPSPIFGREVGPTLILASSKSPFNLTPADVYFGRAKTVLLERERTRRQTIANRRLQHQLHAA